VNEKGDDSEGAPVFLGQPEGGFFHAGVIEAERRGQLPNRREVLRAGFSYQHSPLL